MDAVMNFPGSMRGSNFYQQLNWNVYKITIVSFEAVGNFRALFFSDKFIV